MVKIENYYSQFHENEGRMEYLIFIFFLTNLGGLMILYSCTYIYHNHVLKCLHSGGKWPNKTDPLVVTRFSTLMSIEKQHLVNSKCPWKRKTSTYSGILTARSILPRLYASIRTKKCCSSKTILVQVTILFAALYCWYFFALIENLSIAANPTSFYNWTDQNEELGVDFFEPALWGRKTHLNYK